MTRNQLILILAATLLIMFTAATFTTAEAVSGEAGHCGPATDAKPDPPYAYQQYCCTNDYDENYNIINLRCIIYKCYYGGTILGSKCDLYQPAGKVNAAPEPTGTQGVPPLSTSKTGSGNESKNVGNDFVINDNPTVSDYTKNHSKDTGQLKQLIPIEPESENQTTDNNQLKQLLPTGPQPDNPAPEKGGSEDKGTASNDGANDRADENNN